MLKFYAVAHSLYAAKVRIVLDYKGLEYVEIAPSAAGVSDYKSLVPSGNIPALVDSSILLADSDAINEYLEERYPEASLLPSDLEGRAKVRERSRFHDTRLEPEVRKLYPQIKVMRPDQSAVEAQQDALNLRLGQLGQMLDVWTETDQVTLGDCALPLCFQIIDLLAEELAMEIEWPRPVVTYRQWAKRQSILAAAMDNYALALEHYLETARANRV